MTTKLKTVLSNLEGLSGDELLLLLKHLMNMARRDEALKSQFIKIFAFNQLEGSYRLTPEEAKAGLSDIFTPEELADIETVDLDELRSRPLPKSLAEMISEDREDRF